MSTVLSIFIRLLESMFVVGLLGSFLVIAVTTVEDVEVLVNKEDTGHLSTE